MFHEGYTNENETKIANRGFYLLLKSAIKLPCELFRHRIQTPNLRYTG